MSNLDSLRVFDEPLETFSDKTRPLAISEFDYNIKWDDLYMVGDAYIDEEGLNGHHIKSANEFYTKGIGQIITEGFDIRKVIVNKRTATNEDKSIDHIDVAVTFTKAKIEPPTTLNYTTGKEDMIAFLRFVAELTLSIM